MSKNSTGMTTETEGVVTDDMATMTVPAVDAATVADGGGEALGGASSVDTVAIKSEEIRGGEGVAAVLAMSASVDADTVEANSGEALEVGAASSDAAGVVDSEEATGGGATEILAVAASVDADTIEASLVAEVTPVISGIETDIGGELTNEEVEAAIHARLALGRSATLVAGMNSTEFAELSEAATMETEPNSPAASLGAPAPLTAPRVTLDEEGITEEGESAPSLPARVVMAVSAGEDLDEEGNVIAPLPFEGFGQVEGSSGEEVAVTAASSPTLQAPAAASNSRGSGDEGSSDGEEEVVDFTAEETATGAPEVDLAGAMASNVDGDLSA